MIGVDISKAKHNHVVNVYGLLLPLKYREEHESSMAKLPKRDQHECSLA